MKLCYSNAPSVELGEAQIRAVKALCFKGPTMANVIADEIWPNHKMTSQGAGGAASRVLKSLEQKVDWFAKSAWDGLLTPWRVYHQTYASPSPTPPTDIANALAQKES